VSEQPHHEQTQQYFRALYDAAHAPGALDARTKELIHIAVALAQHCEP
jgi:alkylhydroperoxidase/carboxymuconolactone decarboxylase family protein YurZ